jgi:dehydrogenase/reductase SDR family protein 12
MLPDLVSELLRLPTYTRLGAILARGTSEPLPGQGGNPPKTAVVTGANSGIGFEAALGLARLGARVVLVCRNEARGESAARRIREAISGSTVEVLQADLSDLAQTERAARLLVERHPEIHILVHNAGNEYPTRTLNPQGREAMFALHVLSPFLLNARLASRLARSSLAHGDPARVIFVSSGGMLTSGLDLEDLEWQRRRYQGLLVYAENKRAQAVLAAVFQRFFDDSHLRLPVDERPAIRMDSMHPGWVDTELVRQHLPRFRALLAPVLRTPAQGADTIVWLAATPTAVQRPGGEFFLDRRAHPQWPIPGTRLREGDEARLWNLCREMLEEAGFPAGLPAL